MQRAALKGRLGPLPQNLDKAWPYDKKANPKTLIFNRRNEMPKMPIHEKELPLDITISRTTSNQEEDYISIQIDDDLSSSMIVRIKLSFEQFAKAITGISSCEGIGTVGHLDHIAKKMEMDTLEFEVPEDMPFKDRADVCYELAKKVAPKGWTPDSGFNSKGTFFKKDDVPYARTTIRRYVDLPDDTNAHTENCCPKCGCKYGMKNCPVVNGELKRNSAKKCIGYCIH